MKEIDIKYLRPFEGHPYKVIDNEEMASLVGNIREHGIMAPLIVRRIGDNKYEIISGTDERTRQSWRGLIRFRQSKPK